MQVFPRLIPFLHANLWIYVNNLDSPIFFYQVYSNLEYLPTKATLERRTSLIPWYSLFRCMLFVKIA